ncbi:MAG: peptidase M28, partial [Thermoanaerobaculia bacterium]
MKRLLSLLVLTLPVALDAATVSPITPAQMQAAGEITEALIRSHVKFLASDLLEGRGPATRGGRLAEEYIATELEALGLKPGAPGGGWFQRVPLVAMTPNVPPTMTFVNREKRVELKVRDEFMAFSGVQKPEARIEDAEVVFVG